MKLFRIIAAALALLFVGAPVMAQVSNAQILADIINKLPSGSPQTLTAANVRFVLTEMVNSGRVLQTQVIRSTPPSSVGNWNSVVTACNGDLSQILFAGCYQIIGATTLGQPSVGYLYTQEAYPDILNVFNSSGFNNSTSSNTGRTAAIARYTQISQFGQGDAVANTAIGLLNSSRAGATSYLANPAVSLFNGSIDVGAAGVGGYLNPLEFQLNDDGFDVAAAGAVLNFSRTINTGALGAWWVGNRVQSIGSSPIDVGFSLFGPAQIGLDFTFATLQNSGTYNQAAITLAAGQRIYGNATATDATGLSRFPSATGSAYLSYVSAAGGWLATPMIGTGTTTVGALPACSGSTKGYRYFVTDANAATFHTTAAAGGANNVGVICDGTNWYID